MKLLLAVLVLCVALSAHGQNKITISGDPTDSTVIKRKQRLEAKGFEVVIKKSNPDDNPLLTMGNQAFRQKHLRQALPAFELKDIGGKTVSSNDLKGKYVHINFWSTTCAPCIAEFPELNQLKAKYGDQQWVFLAFAPESAQKVKNVLSKHPLNYTVIADARAYYDQLGIDGYPKNFFVDKKGMILQVTDGTKFVYDTETKQQKPDNYRFYDQIMAAIR